LVTVLDFIAYDISAYHESEWAWQRYRSGFDEKARLADGLFAISEFVAARMRRQFGDVIAPVHAIRLGTDHLDGDQATPAAESADARALSGVPFLLVLGNDFQHKNRDFAVKVFAELRRRGYQGRLVLAGFHVDLGSTYGHELDGAGEAAASIVRRGSVSGADKRWLLANADAVIYPTSVEGFGLVPFEAAALGTPTAFVRFGPLAETMPSVAACPGWNVAAFVVHLEALIADPEPHVRAVMRAAASLTWRGHVDRTMAVYQELLRHPDRWRARRPPPPGRADKAWHVLDALQYRVRRKLGRMLSDLGTAARFANPSEP
jgi:glycosyltransferase involved in cell wall biosynthesis